MTFTVQYHKISQVLLTGIRFHFKVCVFNYRQRHLHGSTLNTSCMPISRGNANTLLRRDLRCSNISRKQVFERLITQSSSHLKPLEKDKMLEDEKLTCSNRFLNCTRRYNVCEGSEKKYFNCFIDAFSHSRRYFTFLCPGLQGLPGACRNQIVRLSVRPFVYLFVRLSVIPSRLQTKCNI